MSLLLAPTQLDALLETRTLLTATAIFALAFSITLSELRQLRIPNRAILAFLSLYPFIEFNSANGAFTQIVASLATLVLGFVAFTAGFLGAGDVKLLSVSVLIFPPEYYTSLVAVFSVFSIVSYWLLRIFRASPMIIRLTPTWEVWKKNGFPLGIPLSGTVFICYLHAVISA